MPQVPTWLIGRRPDYAYMLTQCVQHAHNTCFVCKGSPQTFFGSILAWIDFYAILSTTLQSRHSSLLQIHRKVSFRENNIFNPTYYYSKNTFFQKIPLMSFFMWFGTTVEGPEYEYLLKKKRDLAIYIWVTKRSLLTKKADAPESSCKMHQENWR